MLSPGGRKSASTVRFPGFRLANGLPFRSQPAALIYTFFNEPAPPSTTTTQEERGHNRAHGP
jgi:hypothetical protein